MPKNPDELYSEIVLRILQASEALIMFAAVMEIGLKTGLADIISINSNFTKSFLRSVGRTGKVSSDDESELTSVEKRFQEALTEKSVAKIRAVFDAALLVFAHSLLDGVVTDLCWTIAKRAPKEWESILTDRKVPLSRVSQQTYTELLDSEIEKYLEELDRKSLRERLDILFARCKPTDTWMSAHSDYKYDPDRIARLDGRRHDIIHGDALGKPLPDAKEECFYLLSTALFLTDLIAFRYSFEFDREHLFSFIPFLPPN